MASRLAAAGAALTLTVALAVDAAGPAGAVSVSEKITVGTAKYLTVSYRGNGHGHGLSQYGARGAARSGLTYRQILAFYYPGTRLTTVPRQRIRVKLPNTGRALAIAARPNTTLTGIEGFLPTTGVRKYRLIAGTGTTLDLQRLMSAPGSRWTTVRSGLPNRSEFHRLYGTLVYEVGGTSTEYNGGIRAVRTAHGVYAVDRVLLDNYVAGVVPREMPAGWEPAALAAQAVAARTYAVNAMASSGNGDYDICATTMCQVYGGRRHFAGDGTLLWTQYVPAATDTANRILTYHGSPAFTQFSASNGGWTVDGGQPYMPAQADPYDTPQRSFDPYINVSEQVSVKSVASYFGLAKVTSLQITSRDGHGLWQGRVLAGSVTGTDAGGHPKTVPATGYDFAWAFGLGTTWLRIATTK